jgi:DNA-directed RNA polymerase specialized sigma54-like protein
MNVDARINLNLSQRLVMTPMLQQAIKLLQMSRLELVDLVKQEMLENPVLEDLEEGLVDNGIGEQFERQDTRNNRRVPRIFSIKNRCRRATSVVPILSMKTSDSINTNLL